MSITTKQSNSRRHFILTTLLIGTSFVGHNLLAGIFTQAGSSSKKSTRHEQPSTPALLWYNKSLFDQARVRYPDTTVSLQPHELQAMTQKLAIRLGSEQQLALLQRHTDTGTLAQLYATGKLALFIAPYQDMYTMPQHIVTQSRLVPAPQ